MVDESVSANDVQAELLERARAGVRRIRIELENDWLMCRIAGREAHAVIGVVSP